MKKRIINVRVLSDAENVIRQKNNATVQSAKVCESKLNEKFCFVKLNRKHRKELLDSLMLEGIVTEVCCKQPMIKPSEDWRGMHEHAMIYDELNDYEIAEDAGLIDKAGADVEAQRKEAERLEMELLKDSVEFAKHICESVFGTSDDCIIILKKVNA